MKIFKRGLCFMLACTMLLATAGCNTKQVIKTTGNALIGALKVNYAVNPMGVDTPAPLFSWTMEEAGVRGQRQTKYQIMVASTRDNLLRGDYDVWDSGVVESSQSLAVTYGGPTLTPSTRYYWQVQVWDKDGNNCLSSEEAYFETGLMETGFSDAQWIMQDAESGLRSGAPIVRKSFKLDQSKGKIAQARAYASAAGLYELYLNGQKVGDDFLNPGSTQYDQHVMYQSFDITEMLQSGDNTVSAMLGRGWYCGWAGLVFNKPQPAFIGKIVIEYTDGSVQTIVSDGSWEYTLDGPITENDIYNGETYNARKTPEEYRYSPVKVTSAEELDIGTITSQVSGTVKAMQTLEPISMTETSEGTYLYDFGQNFAGVAEITVNAEAGTVVTMRFGEMLNDDSSTADGPEGTLYTANLRGAEATDRYNCMGTGEETWHPVFTYHGFRYVEVTGVELENIVSLKALVLYSDMADSSTFECSNAMINQLSSNTYWGQRSNFLVTPTDCPQRDERYGYLGDAQVFCGTAMYQMDTKTFFDQFMMSIADCQQLNGTFPNSAPGAYKTEDQAAHGGWADGGIIIPYTMYVRYGDLSLIEKYYDNMVTYLDYMLRDAGDDFIRDSQPIYGDWLVIGESTPVPVIDTAYCAYTFGLMSEMAGWLGKTDDQAKYADYSQKFKDAWCNAYLNEDGSTTCDTQTSYAMGLTFDIIPDEIKPASTQKLVDRIEANGWKIAAGYAGVSRILPALTENGRSDVAFRLLEQTECPSWLYPVTLGATTIWERWDGYVPGEGFQDPSMNSFNHYAFGSVMDWVYSSLIGIQCDTTKDGAAFSHFTLQPHTGGSLTYASGSYVSMYGTIESSWKLENGNLVYTCTVPANTTATLRLPCAEGASVQESGNPADSAEGVTAAGYEDGAAVFELASGTYTFTVAAN